MTAGGETFVRVDDRGLILAIGQARQQLVFVAPGVRKQVAEALANAMDVIPVDAIHLVIDPSNRNWNSPQSRGSALGFWGSGYANGDSAIR